MYILVGAFDYDGDSILGLFNSLSEAKQGRIDYRRAVHANLATEYDEYQIYDVPIGQLLIRKSDNFVLGYQPVHVHRKTERNT